MAKYITYLSKENMESISCANKQVNPIVLDEYILNLCRSINKFSILFPNVDFNKEKIGDIELEVLDIDFNISNANGTKIEIFKENPDYISINLSDIDIKFLGKVLDYNSKIIAEKSFTLKYLQSSEDGFNEVTNPRNVIIELYKPKEESGNYISDYNMKKKMQHHSVNTEAFGKVINLDMNKDTADIMLTVYFKSIYFKSYKEQCNVKKVELEDEFKL